MTSTETARRSAEVPRNYDPPKGFWKWVGRVVVAWIALVALAPSVHAPWAVRRGALFLHLAAVIAGFGAVLVVDLHGLLWFLGRRRLGEFVQLVQTLQSVIWTALGVLVASGLFLEPNILLARTAIKLVLVLAAAINGLWAHRLSSELRCQPGDADPDDIDPRLLIKVMASGAISQSAWWGATLIGFLTTTSR